MEITRREFFKFAGVGGAILWLPGCEATPNLNPEFGISYTRPEDLVVLRFEFANLSLLPDESGGQYLVPKGSSTGYMIVHFGSQHFHERSVDENAVDTFVGPPPYPASILPPPPVNAMLSGPSRVVLRVPAGTAPIPYTGEGLLDAIRKLEMNVAPNATPPEAPKRIITLPVGSLSVGATPSLRKITQSRKQLAATRYLASTSSSQVSALDPSPPVEAKPNVRPREPANGETALELPFRLILSPNKHGRWAHGTRAEHSLKNGRYELWHTRLATLDPLRKTVTEAPHGLRTVRAIWTRDFDIPRPAPNNNLHTKPYTAVPPDQKMLDFGLASLAPFQRGAIVHLSSNYIDWDNHPNFVPKPVDANKLMLSALGGWLEAHADFTLQVPSPPGLVSWDHFAAMGRDYFVKVVMKGRLYPWGHTAVLIQVTERKFRGPNSSIAYLWTRFFIEIVEPERTYPAAWRKFPFSSVRFKTLVTPNLDIPNPLVQGAKPVRTTPSTPFRFKMQAVDRDGNIVNFDAVATWLPDHDNMQPSYAELIAAQNIYNAYSEADRTSRLAGQRVAYSESAKADDTTYETSEIVFDGTRQGTQAAGVPFPSAIGLPFVAGISEARLNIEAIRHLIGQEGSTAFEYHARYLQHGFPPPETTSGHPNQGEVLFGIKGGGSVTANFSKNSESSGGFVDPSMSFKGLSRKTQLASDLDNVAQDKFDPMQYLPDAMLFGVVPFKDVLPIGAIKDAPNFVTQTLDVVSGFISDSEALMAFLAKLEDDITSSAKDVLADLREKLDDVLEAIGNLLNLGSSNPDDVDDELPNVASLVDQLLLLLDDVLDAADALPDVLDTEKEDLKRRARSIKNVLDGVKSGLKAFATGLEMVKNLTVKFEWRTPLDRDAAGFFVPNTSAPKGGFLLAVEARGKQIGNNPPGFSVVAGIENFKINVFGESAKLVAIPFKRLLFKVESNRKPEIDVVFAGDVGFDDILAFIQTLAKLIPGAGFSDPPALEVDAEGIRASFSVPIPSVAVGVFSIQNMRLGAGFEVPFIGNPLSISFFFCTREEPFVLTVMMVGGGGFVNLKLSPKGLMMLEAAFEARAQLAVDFGVASGSISIAVGVYFRLEVTVGPPEKQAGELTGYLRFQGKVDVLGLISASITLLLEMTYEFESKKLIGRATLTIEVSILFFDFTVEVSCERKLAGSNDDPTFLDQMAVLNPGMPDEFDPWAEYLESFVLAA